MTVKLLPCPFCASPAEFERIGTARVSNIVRCTDCGARLESGENFNQGSRWNCRAPVPEGFELVPIAAIKWLNGEGLDDTGKHFGEGFDRTQRSQAFWWRRVFNRMRNVQPASNTICRYIDPDYRPATHKGRAP